MTKSRASAVTAPQVRDAAPLFAALGDETRLRLIVRLSSGGPGSITQLSAKSGRVSSGDHEAPPRPIRRGLVRSTRRGRESVWELETKRLGDAHEYLDRISQQWDEALDRLRKFVED